MAVTKRTRYEVLRRDNHTCRYCHATDAPLTVDHVTPKALGGTDDPSNLVAACKDCNAGKSSAAPDSSLVADVAEDALRHAEMIRQAYAVVVERMGDRDDYIAEFEEAYVYGMPDDWRITVGRWFEMGVPIELVVDAARIACAKTQRFNGTARFSYMCGIVWNQVHAVSEAVELKSAILGAFMTEDARSDESIESYQQGCRFGEDRGRRVAKWDWGQADVYHRLLLNVVERSYPWAASGTAAVMDRMSGPISELTPGEALQPAGDPW